MSNRFFISILVIIAVVFGFFAFNKQKNNSDGSASSNTSQPTNHTKGSTETGVALIEYGDFQCPACSQYYPIVKQIAETYKDKITVQFRNFPLIQIHPNAMAAHRAAEAADKQGKFWEMHDLLYETQNDWASSNNAGPIFESYAQQLGLDMGKFKTDVASEEINALINADRQEGNKIGANSTPTFVLDGVKVDNPRSLEDFTKLIDEAIAKKARG